MLLPIRVIAPTDQRIVVFQKNAIDPLELLWKATCLVESNNDPLALNVKEQACGIVQIRQVRINHYNRLTGKSYRLEDAFNPAVSREIWDYYATDNLECTARSWNGGPTGMRKKSTIKYWKLIQRYL